MGVTMEGSEESDWRKSMQLLRADINFRAMNEWVSESLDFPSIPENAH